MYISLTQSIRKPWKLPLGTTTLNTFVNRIGLWQTLEKLHDLEKYWANAVIYNDVIKSSLSGSICWCDSVEIKLELFLNSAI